MKILVHLIDKNEEVEQSIKSKDIICPLCKEPCRIKMENYKLKLYDCINNHSSTNINIIDFPKTQNINISKIVCNNCKIKNKGNTMNNDFYRCLTCEKNLCILCRSSHDLTHSIINYDQKNFICLKHNKPLIEYCTKYNLNVCFLCEEEHQEHELISFRDLMPKIKETKMKLSEI